ncbi:hypothetical protein F4802DRAFT_571577 [Xylaria palmicola]|nr:hypothetical protein F4802DRAFT_571577 [Xylaria palmicola]
MEHPPFVGWALDWSDSFSTTDRLNAVRSFGKSIIDPVGWEQSWHDGGGTSGILHLLSSASVKEVKVFCNAIRASNRRGKKSADRERAVEELVMALFPQHYPSTKLRTRDERPLHKLYVRMLRGCSSGFVERILDAQDNSNPLFQKLALRKLLHTHLDMLKRRLRNYLMHEGPQPSASEMDICFRECVFREPPYPGAQPHMSASMEFGLELLQARVTRKSTAERWPRDVPELQVLVSIFRRFIRKSRSANRTFLLKLGLQLVELRPDSNLSSDGGVLWSAILFLWKKYPRYYEDLLLQGIRLGLRNSKTILPEIITRWKDDPDQYENLLIQSLREGLAGSEKEISESYLTALSSVPREKLAAGPRWRLLRLYCQHVPEKGIDIETSSDFTCFAKQQWSFEAIHDLERNHAVLFLDRLYKVNPHCDFLIAPRGHISIYSMRNGPRRNFNVDLLLTAYNQGDADAQKRARDEVDQLRQKAAISREPKDRAIFAKAAAHYAIATGDLEVYAETLLWQHRFIRDPLTVLSIFASDAILTSEGIALLSGLSLSPTEDTTTLSVIRQRLAIANQMLERFNEAQKLAMKEPSYNRSAWMELSSLYCDVYTERVSRVKKVKLQPNEKPLDLFHIIWEGTADLAQSIGSEFLIQASQSIYDLLGWLSGPSLITASETLLDCAASWGKKENRSSDEDSISATMDNLTYRVVSKLAHSDTPVLAQDLIQRAIIEHPETSSWHRQFLSIGYMRALPADDAKSMLLSFAAAIGEKLEEQSYVKVGDKESPKSAPPRSLVKVTTVKYLAQLLNDADFISPNSAVEVLIELFKSATHIDIRLATLDSLLSTLNAIIGDSGEQWRSNPMVEKILNTLDSVVSIAGDVNERRPVGAAEWAKAEAEATIPDVSDTADIPPLFLAVLKAATGVQFPHLRKLQGALFSRVVLPTLHRSQEQHRRWFSLFLAKYGSAVKADSLPRVPITPAVWHYMLAHQGHLLPPTTLDEYNQYVLLQLRTPPVIKTLNKTLESDVTLRNDPSVEHWLYIFGKPWQHRSWDLDIDSLLNLIATRAEKTTSTSDLMGLVVSQASVLLDDYENRPGRWSQLVTSLGPARLKYSRYPVPENGSDDTHREKPWAHWRETTALLAQRLITLIEQKAGSSAQPDNTILPSTFPLRLWCLPYPVADGEKGDAGFRDLATALDKSLSSFLQSEEGDALLWTRLADDVHATLASAYRTKMDRLRAAVYVGDLVSLGASSEPAATATQLVRVAVALRLVDGESKNKALRKPPLAKDRTPETLRVGELVKRLRAVMDGWGQRRRGPSGKRPPPFGDMVVQWKAANKAVWEHICSWEDPAGDDSSRETDS